MRGWQCYCFKKPLLFHLILYITRRTFLAVGGGKRYELLLFGAFRGIVRLPSFQHQPRTKEFFTIQNARSRFIYSFALFRRVHFQLRAVLNNADLFYFSLFGSGSFTNSAGMRYFSFQSESEIKFFMKIICGMDYDFLERIMIFKSPKNV